MDPNEALQRARRALERAAWPQTAAARAGELEELAEAFEALDGWLSRGGFLPRAWVSTPPAGGPRRRWSHAEDLAALDALGAAATAFREADAAGQAGLLRLREAGRRMTAAAGKLGV